MLKSKRRSQQPTATVEGLTFSAPPPSNPVEIGLALRAGRERRGLSLEQVRDATGVPRIDIAALESGRLEVLHVEQAAVVGLWRYAELVGMNPEPLIPVLRSHWPRPSLAVDALYSAPGGEGMACARLALAERLLSQIIPKGRELSAGSAPLGLSAATRARLGQGAASAMLTVAVLGPARAAREPRDRPTPGGRTSSGSDGEEPAPALLAIERPRNSEPPEDTDRRAETAAGPDPEPEPVETAETDPEPEPVETAETAETATGPDPEPEPFEATLTAAPVTASWPRADPRPRRWPRHLAHTVAERFGLDAEPADSAEPAETAPVVGTDPAAGAG